MILIRIVKPCALCHHNLEVLNHRAVASVLLQNRDILTSLSVVKREDPKIALLSSKCQKFSSRNVKGLSDEMRQRVFREWWIE